VVLARPLASGQEKGNLRVWSPNPNLLEQLAPESKSESWSIRPPAGYASRVTRADNETRTIWAGKGGAIVVTVASVPASGKTPDQALHDALELLKGRSRNFAQTDVESGLVNGKTFYRARYSADALPGLDSRGFGFLYLTFESKTPIVISGVGSNARIETIEASAQTFRDLKR
jgi:hypothetical protein